MNATPTVAAALRQARAVGVDRLDAQLLLAELLQRPRTWLIAHDDAPLDAVQAARYADWLRRRRTGEPLAYILGLKEFHGLPLQVDARVLVPRPETEHLVDWALELLQAGLSAVARPRVIDLGTGSGAIALAVQRAWPSAEVCAVDRSAAALAVARANGQRLGLDIEWLEGSWWTPIAGGRRFELVLSNPPYVADDDPHLAALRAEPLSALAAGPDGLNDLRLIVAGASAHLTHGGWLLLEHGHDQGAAVRDLLQAGGFEAVSTRRDLAGLDRCTAGRWPAVHAVL